MNNLKDPDYRRELIFNFAFLFFSSKHINSFMKPISLIVCVYLLSIATVHAAITLPEIFTDNMVLQRDKPLKVWGDAGKGETVTVSFNGQKVNAKADKNGQWLVTLKAMSYGGPYDMVLSAKSGTVTL